MKQLILSALAVAALPCLASAQNLINLAGNDGVTTTSAVANIFTINDVTASPVSLVGVPTATNADIRGIAFDPVTNQLCVASEDADSIALFSTTGTFNGFITQVNTAENSGVDPYLVQVSDDGQIFTQSFGGAVERVGPAAAGTSLNIEVVNTSVVAGLCRGFDVGGSHTAGTAAIILGDPTNLYILTQSAAGSDTFTLQNTIPHGIVTVALAADEPELLWIAPGATSFIVGAAAGTGQTTAPMRKFNGTPGGTYTQDLSFAPAGIFQTGIDVVPSRNAIVSGLRTSINGGSIRVILQDFTTGALLVNKTYTVSTGATGSGSAAIDPATGNVFAAGGNSVIGISGILSVPSSVETWDLY